MHVFALIIHAVDLDTTIQYQIYIPCRKGPCINSEMYIINRSSVPAEPDKNMNSSEDFLLLLLHTHVVQVGKVLQLSNPHAYASVGEFADQILEKFTHFPSWTTVNTPSRWSICLLH